MRSGVLSNAVWAWLALSLTAIPMVAAPPAASACRQQMWADAHAVAADLVEIWNQTPADVRQNAVEQFADSLQEILPTLNQTAQAALEKFILKLRDMPADDPSSGSSVAPMNRIALADALVALLAAGGSSSDAQQIFAKLVASLASLDDVLLAPLVSDLNTLAADAQSCRG